MASLRFACRQPGDHGELLVKTVAPKVEVAGDASHYGLFVRDLRQRRELTLDQLADRTGLSKGHLSRFERGEKALSLAALIRVANVLGTAVSTLLGERVGEDALHLVRNQERKYRKAPKGDGGYVFSALSRASSTSGTTAAIVEIPAKSSRTSSAYHAGEEMLFVVEGGIEIEFPDQSIILQKGDFLQFPGHLRHTLKGQASRSQVFIAIVGS
jgi:transcriptional regulator with XRE-family HTH domain